MTNRIFNNMNYDNNDWLLDIINDKFLEVTQEEMPDQQFTEEDIEEIAEEALEKITEEVGSEIYEYVLNDSDGLNNFREKKSRLEKNIQERWKEPLNLLEKLILWSQQIGQNINSEHRFEAAQKQDFIFEALIQIHGRGVQVAMEIHQLLKSGFADGALARWRLLYELSIDSLYILKREENIAEQYLIYPHIKDYYFAKCYQKHSDDLDLEKIDDKAMNSAKKTIEDIQDKFGSGFNDEGYGNGWTYDSDGCKSVNVRAKKVGLNHYKPYYDLACNTVHGDPKGTLDRLGIIQLPDVEQPEYILSGPSNAGLSVPGKLTAIFLSQITFTLINMISSALYIAQRKGMQRLVDDINRSFGDKAKELEKDEREAMEEWANQDIIEIALNYVGAKKLLTTTFIDKHSEFSSKSEFEEAIPVKIKDIDDLKNLSQKTKNKILNKTDFKKMEELIDLAFEMWVRENVDLNLD